MAPYAIEHLRVEPEGDRPMKNMRSPRRLTMSTTLALIVASGMAPVAPGAQATSASTPSLSPDTATTIITHYQTELDSQWTSSNTTSSRTKLTKEEISNQHVRDKLVAAGEPVKGAKSTVSVIGIVMNDDGTATATTTISTTFTYGGAHTAATSDGVMTDTHSITLTPDKDENFYVSEDIVTSHEEIGDPNNNPDGYSPQQSSNDESTQTQAQSSGSGSAGSTSLPSNLLPAYNTVSPDVAKMQEYAATWTSTPNDGDDEGDFNPDYPYFENNCTNFVSQVLRAGGWEYDNGFRPKNTENWAPNLWGPAGASWTWNNTSYQYTYVSHGSYSTLGNIWNAKPGDILYTDWDPNGTPDGTIDHAMVVTGTTPEGDPAISQKTRNRSNISLHHSIFLAEEQGKSIVWYGLQRNA